MEKLNSYDECDKTKNSEITHEMTETGGEREEINAASEYIKEKKEILIPVEKLPDNLKGLAGDYWRSGGDIIYFDKQGNVAKFEISRFSGPISMMNDALGSGKTNISTMLEKLGFHKIEEVQVDKINEIQEVLRQLRIETVKNQREMKVNDFEF